MTGKPVVRQTPWGAIIISGTVALAVFANVTFSIVTRAIDNGCVADCLTRQDLAMQSNMALAAWAVLIVSVASGGGSLYLIFRTLQAAVRSADAAEETVRETRRIGEAGTRAYLIIREANLERSTQYNTDWKVRFVFENSGQTPAVEVFSTIEIRYQIGPASQDNPWFFESRPRSDTASKDVKNAVAPVQVSILKTAQGQSEATIWANIRIDYEDVFGIRQTVDATYTLSVTPYFNPDPNHPASMMRYRDIAAD